MNRLKSALRSSAVRRARMWSLPPCRRARRIFRRGPFISSCPIRRAASSISPARGGAKARRSSRSDRCCREPAGRRRHRRRRLRRSRRPTVTISSSWIRRSSSIRRCRNDALRHLQGSGDDLDRQFVAGSSGGCAATRRQDLRRARRLRQSQSRQAQLRARPASAPRRISPPRCGRSAPASRRPMCRTRASVRRSST